MNLRFFRFISIGVFDTFLDVFLFTILIFVFGKTPQNIIILNMFSFSIVVCCAYILNGKYTFYDTNYTYKKLLKYYTSSLFGMMLNTIIVYSVMMFGFGTIVSKIIAACFVVFYNYTMCKKFVFVVK